MKNVILNALKNIQLAQIHDENNFFVYWLYKGGENRKVSGRGQCVLIIITEKGTEEDGDKAEASKSQKTPELQCCPRWTELPSSLILPVSTKVFQCQDGFPALLMGMYNCSRCEGLPQLLHSAKYMYYLPLFQKSDFFKRMSYLGRFQLLWPCD